MHTSFGTFLSLLFELIMVFLQVDSKKKKSSFPNNSRTRDLLVASPDALTLR